MGQKDETVPFAFVRGVWEDWTRSGRLVTGSKFVEIAGGDHGLVNSVNDIAEAVRAHALRRD